MILKYTKHSEMIVWGTRHETAGVWANAGGESCARSEKGSAERYGQGAAAPFSYVPATPWGAMRGRIPTCSGLGIRELPRTPAKRRSESM